MHYFNIWMCVVRDVSKGVVVNSLQKWVSASLIKTVEEQGTTALHEIVGIMNKS